ncbi:hypothetical protein [Streptomyces sp. NPDC006334]|uniref:TetR family transcriptional regulator C-terminal domain-containing protein n=1 Tax=Streptomyces sp. NPDC006334 TaxID=3156754 RepID=UPI0033AD9AE7
MQQGARCGRRFIGALAETLDMSKVVDPLGSRVELQLAAPDRAWRCSRRRWSHPGRATAPGLPRLYAVIDAWCAYLADSPFPNGCFVTAASCDLDAGDAVLGNRLHDTVTRWRGFLTEETTTAQAAGDLDPHLDPDDLVSLLASAASCAPPSPRSARCRPDPTYPKATTGTAIRPAVRPKGERASSTRGVAEPVGLAGTPFLDGRRGR